MWDFARNDFNINYCNCEWYYLTFRPWYDLFVRAKTNPNGSNLNRAEN